MPVPFLGRRIGWRFSIRRRPRRRWKSCGRAYVAVGLLDIRTGRWRRPIVWGWNRVCAARPPPQSQAARAGTVRGRDGRGIKYDAHFSCLKRASLRMLGMCSGIPAIRISLATRNLKTWHRAGPRGSADSHGNIAWHYFVCHFRCSSCLYFPIILSSNPSARAKSLSFLTD